MARNGPQAPIDSHCGRAIDEWRGVVTEFLLCDDLQHCCNRVVLSFAMGSLGPTVLNTPFFARSKVGYPEAKQKDSSFLCRYRQDLCKIGIVSRARAQNRREDVWRWLGSQSLARAERLKSGLGLSFAWKDAHGFCNRCFSRGDALLYRRTA